MFGSLFEKELWAIVLWRENFCETLLKFLTKLIILLEYNWWNCWLQQIGRRPILWTQTATAFWQDFFGDLFVVREPCTPRLPNLAPRDFFLWELHKVYSHNPTVWSTLNIILNKLLPALTKERLENLQETLRKGSVLLFGKVGNIFTICCNYPFQLFATLAIIFHKIFSGRQPSPNTFPRRFYWILSQWKLQNMFITSLIS